MINPDRQPSTETVNLNELRERYPDPESMIEDLISGVVSSREVHARFPDIDDAEYVIYSAEGIVRERQRAAELLELYPTETSFVEAYLQNEVEMEDIPLRFPDRVSHSRVQHLIDRAEIEKQYPTIESMADNYRWGMVTEGTVAFRFEDESDQKRVYELAAELNAADEAKLDKLLDDPQNKFLQIAKNLERIESAHNAAEALKIAEDLIWERETRTFEFQPLRQVEGVELGEVDVEGVKKTIEAIKQNNQEIGRGGDAFVVIYKGEQTPGEPAEICYKFAIEETVKRGRNSITAEAAIHTDFFEAAQKLEDSPFGIPMPYYATAIGSEQLIAMEKLPAKSIDDILHGKGELPEWLDIDRFCDELRVFLDELHARGLYHRDMHEGNIMVRQTNEAPLDGKWGYLIDFGLSAHGREGMDPYAKEVAGTRFTYTDDYVIIDIIRQKLIQLRERQLSSNGRVV